MRKYPFLLLPVLTVASLYMERFGSFTAEQLTYVDASAQESLSTSDM